MNSNNSTFKPNIKTIDPSWKLVGRKIYEYRSSLNKTQEELASELRIPRTLLTMLENGQRDPTKYLPILLSHGMDIQ